MATQKEDFYPLALFLLTGNIFRYKSIIYILRANAEDGNQTISPNRKTTRMSYVKTYRLLLR